MERSKFNNIVENRKELITEVLQRKGAEYASDQNVFENFYKAMEPARVGSKEKALWCMAMKHFVSIGDMVEETEQGINNRFPIDYIEEKIGDMINYLILLEAMLKSNHQ